MVNFGDSKGWNKEITVSRIGASDTSPHWIPWLRFGGIWQWTLLDIHDVTNNKDKIKKWMQTHKPRKHCNA